jgi:diguanylate cyclase (GGDEF)-like protein
VLQASAKRVQSVLRSYDAVGRLGGEEFLLLLPGCEPREAVEIADRARLAIAAEPIDGPSGPVPMSMSLGVACRRASDPTEAVALLEAADAALYRAKAHGRNHVCL